MENTITRSTLLDYFNDELTPAEETAVEKWRHADEENHRRFIEAQNEYLRMQWGIQGSQIKGDFSTVRKRINFPRRKLHLRIITATSVSAAAFIVMVLIFRGFYSGSTADLSTIVQAHNMPILELSDGMRYELDDHKNILVEKNGSTLSLSNGEISYRTEFDASDEVIYNKIIIPRGANSYRVRLNDGSVVWLNSDSSLEYPLNFTGTERRVTLAGEGFFEVVRNEEKPFIVESGEQSVRVLGTEFNVSMYPCEGIVTTLVSGKVMVQAGENASGVTLSPGEQARFDSGTGSISVAQVKTEDYISWRDGRISIDKNTFRQALAKISRKFDVEFDISDPELENRVLKGSIPAGEDFDTILFILRKAVNVEFKLEKDGKIKVVRN